MVQLSIGASCGKNTALFQVGKQIADALGSLSPSQLAAKAYIATMMTFALLTVLDAIASWHASNLWLFAAYLVIAILAPRLGIGLPLLNDPVPLNSLIILLGIAQLTLAQALAVGCCS